MHSGALSGPGFSPLTTLNRFQEANLKVIMTRAGFDMSCFVLTYNEGIYRHRGNMRELEIWA